MLKNFLLEHRDAVVKRWVQLVLETYPDDASRFYKQEKDRFANPVGSNIAEAVERIYDLFVDGSALQELAGPMDNIIRIRAVQEFTPSKAVGFVFLLKKAVRERLYKQNPDMETVRELIEFEADVDRLALLAFELYMGCREQLYNLRATEVENRSVRVLERAARKLGYFPEDEGERGQGPG